MRTSTLVAILCCGVALSGCASVIEGLHQKITVATNPADASCVFTQHGAQIGTIDHTPGSLIVRKSKYDIDIKCSKASYRDTSFNNHSGVSSMIAGNIIADLTLTLGASSIVDSATGADNKYQDVVTLTLIPESAGAVAVPAVVTMPATPIAVPGANKPTS